MTEYTWDTLDRIDERAGLEDELSLSWRIYNQEGIETSEGSLVCPNSWGMVECL